MTQTPMQPREKLRQIPPTVAAVADYEPFARERMTAEAWAYIAGGAADEITLQENIAAFRRLQLRPRVLQDLSGGSTALDLLGQRFAFPILLAPVAFHRLVHPDGEIATAMAAAAMGTGMIVSTQASITLEDIIRQVRSQGSTAPLWFQLYIQPDREFTLNLVRRAEAAGYGALVLTVDAPVNGVRNQEQRLGFALPPGVEPVNLRGMRPPPATAGRAGEPIVMGGPLLAAAPTWKDIDWLRGATRLPLLLKGITSGEDAREAVAHGVDGIVVSNHGGRVLDTLPASIDVLPEVARAVDGRVPVLMDGGVRRGTDVLKALALGAAAVLIGRPYIYGLAAAGAVGVSHVLHILRAELEFAMALTGCRNLEAIGPWLLRGPAQAGPHS